MDSTSEGDVPAGTSTRPYLIRALHDWCTDNGFTPYLAVQVDRSVQVPMEYVNNNEIVLNVGFDATSSLDLGNDFIQFKARFGGVAREIVVPVDHVVAIYARENGQGMAFPPFTATDEAKPAESKPAPKGLRLATVPAGEEESESADVEEPPPPDDDGGGGAPAGARPALKRIK